MSTNCLIVNHPLRIGSIHDFQHNLLAASQSIKSHFRSGFQTVYAGSLPDRDSWSKRDWSEAPQTTVSKGQFFTTNYTMSANNFDFPLMEQNSIVSSTGTGASDLRAILTAVYASSVGVLSGYLVPFMAAATCATPEQAYSGEC